MAEQDFYASQGNRFRGSRYANFTGGVINSQGNVGGVAPTANPGLLDTSAGTQTSNVSTNLTQMQSSQPNVEIPSVGESVKNAAIGAAVPYAATEIGSVAGGAMAGGATFGEGIKQGVSSLGSKVGGLFSRGASEAGSAAGSAVSGTAAGAGSGAAAGGASSGAAGGAAGSTAGGEAGSSFGSRLTSGSNLGGAAGAGLGAAAATLLTGGSVGDAAKSGAGSAIGFAVGNAVLPGIGGVVGSVLGGAIGGRVICTQLVREGLLHSSDQRLDMEFTFHRLSNIHARGYLFWARGYVEKMKRSPMLTRVTYRLVVWRLDEIKYQLGLRETPCYRGKVVRWIMEPLCYMIGMCLQDTAESRIYKKEIMA